MSENEATADAVRGGSDAIDGTTLSTIHHDLKNDLNLLTNYSQFLACDDSSGQIVHVVSKKLAASLNALLLSQRLQSGPLKPTPEQVNPTSLTEERIDWFNPLYEHVERDLTTTSENPPETVRTDRQFLRVILDCLLVIGSKKPKGQTELTLSGTNGSPPSESSPGPFSVTVRQSNPPWRIQRTSELKEALREAPLQELVSTFSARVGLFLHSMHRLLETQGGTLTLGSSGENRVLIEANVPSGSQNPT